MAQTVKRLAYNEGDLGLIPGSGRSSGEGNGNPLQYSCMEIPWAKSLVDFQELDMTEYMCMHTVW